MQTLGLADSTPRSESRIKALLWPSIQNATDVDYITTQGLWICTFFGVLSLLGGFLSGHEFFALLVFLMYFLGGVGVREGSIVAASFALLYYLVDTVASGPGIFRIICLALLFANLRATWLAAKWSPESPEAEAAPRLSETLGDKISDQLPRWLWPKIRYFYYAYAFVILALTTAGLFIVYIRRTQLPG